MAEKVTGVEMEEEENAMTIEELVDMGDECLGLRVVVETKADNYLGVVNLVLPPSRRLYLEKASDTRTAKRRPGLFCLFFHHVLSVRVLGEDVEARERLLKDIYREETTGKQVLSKKFLHPHLLEQHRQEDQRDEDDDGGVNVPPLPPATRVSRPDKWLVIDQLGEAFDKAVSVIREERTIAVGMEGHQQGRAGSLVWLTVATSNYIFLFDVAKMGRE